MWTSPRDILHAFFGRLSKIVGKYRTCFYVSLYMYVCLDVYLSTYSQYWKNNDIEMHFKEYARKWRLEDVYVNLVRRSQ